MRKKCLAYKTEEFSLDSLNWVLILTHSMSSILLEMLNLPQEVEEEVTDLGKFLALTNY